MSHEHAIFVSILRTLIEDRFEADIVHESNPNYPLRQLTVWSRNRVLYLRDMEELASWFKGYFYSSHTIWYNDGHWLARAEWRRQDGYRDTLFVKIRHAGTNNPDINNGCFLTSETSPSTIQPHPFSGNPCDHNVDLKQNQT